MMDEEARELLRAAETSGAEQGEKYGSDTALCVENDEGSKAEPWGAPSLARGVHEESREGLSEKDGENKKCEDSFTMREGTPRVTAECSREVSAVRPGNTSFRFDH